jgi:hypothetical protein
MAVLIEGILTSDKVSRISDFCNIFTEVGKSAFRWLAENALRIVLEVNRAFYQGHLERRNFAKTSARGVSGKPTLALVLAMRFDISDSL